VDPAGLGRRLGSRPGARSRLRARRHAARHLVSRGRRPAASVAAGGGSPRAHASCRDRPPPSGVGPDHTLL